MIVDKHLRFFVNITALVIALDQISKYVIQFYNPNIGNYLFKIQLTTNTGAGFGILKNSTSILTMISLIVAITCIYYYHKVPKEKVIQTCYALFLGGVVGNLIDRLLLGQVIDFINLPLWPTFNIADAAITIGVIGIIIKTWKKS